jgi:hypothetical protein
LGTIEKFAEVFHPALTRTNLEQGAHQPPGLVPQEAVSHEVEVKAVAVSAAPNLK